MRIWDISPPQPRTDGGQLAVPKHPFARAPPEVMLEIRDFSASALSPLPATISRLPIVLKGPIRPTGSEHLPRTEHARLCRIGDSR